MQSGDLARARVGFDAPSDDVGAGGVVRRIWSELYQCGAKVIYQRGSEVVESARLEGRAIYKIKIRSCAASRAVDVDWRMRDLRNGLPSGEDGDPLPGTRYAILEVDTASDPLWVYLVVEKGRAA
ncbi:MAG: head-tail adaptor protein [Sphingomonadales bacterium]|nr:head-tail adaptor protein [Sphingomonadales bacterium]